MKKMTTILIAGTAIAAASYAQTTTVSSANIVGYAQAQTPPSGVFKIIALTQFSDGTTNNSVDIQDVINNPSDLNADIAGSGAAGADKLHVYTGAGYSSYALFQPSSGTPYWASVNELGWTSGLEFMGVNATTDLIGRGAAIWYETAAGGASTNLITSGDVYLDNTFSVTIPSGYSLLAYPYSSDITLDQLVISNATSAVAGSGAVGADKLHVYTGAGYESYALFQPASGAPYWASVNELGWTAGLEFLGVAVATNTISLGAGFWYETVAGKTIGFEKIYIIE
jgi:hypothetical protein